MQSPLHTVKRDSRPLRANDVEHSALLTSFLREGVRNRVYPGAVLFVRHQGHIPFHEAVGKLSTFPGSLQVHRDTLYDLASLTKPLATASAILWLVQDGKLELGQPLETVLKETRNHPLGKRAISDFLCHQSGLPAWRPLYQAFPSDSHQESFRVQPRVKVVLEAIMKELPPETVPRECRYSDLGYILLGFVIEQVTGQSLKVFCEERIFRPIGAVPLGYLPRSGMAEGEERARIAPTERDSWRGRLLQGEVHDENAYILGGIAGHAGLFGTAEAVSQVTKIWLDGYLGRPVLFDTKLVRQFVKAQPGFSWALGWDTPSTPSSSGHGFSLESFGHLGFTGTSIWIDPVRELEVIFLSNRVHPTRDNLAIKSFRPQLHDLIVQECC